MKRKIVSCWNCGMYGGSSKCGICDGFGNLSVSDSDLDRKQCEWELKQLEKENNPINELIDEVAECAVLISDFLGSKNISPAVGLAAMLCILETAPSVAKEMAKEARERMGKTNQN